MEEPDEPGDEPRDGYGLAALYNFAYCSRAAPGVDQQEVERIVAVAQRRNPRMAITGLLVFGGGVFFQWIEGPRDNVRALIERLRADPRHDTLVALDESEEVRERVFPDWDMELVSSADIREVLADALENATNATTAAALERLIAMQAGRETPG